MFAKDKNTSVITVYKYLFPPSHTMPKIVNYLTQNWFLWLFQKLCRVKENPNNNACLGTSEKVTNFKKVETSYHFLKNIYSKI